MRRVNISFKLLTVIFSTITPPLAYGTSVPRFAIGDTVQVITNLNVRTGPGTNYPEIQDPDYIGYAPTGTFGQVTGGPTNADAYVWWEVDYGPGSYSGWSVQDGLEKFVTDPEIHPHGWYWPAGTSDPGGYRGWLGPYDGKYHLAQDFKSPTGAPVHALTDGTILYSRTDVNGYGLGGTKGGALVALFKTSTGQEFKALYGHINYPLSEGLYINAGEVLGYLNEYDPPHLHFGIHPGSALPPDGNPWRGYTSDPANTYGWTDPIAFLNDNYPLSQPDIDPPVVNDFSISSQSVGLCDSFTICYMVSDNGGSGLDRSELWRANDSGGSPLIWTEIKRTSLSGNGPSTGCFYDAPLSEGAYWYGVHVVDNVSNWNDERNSKTGGVPGIYGPIKVTVDANPPIVSAFSVDPTPPVIRIGRSFTVFYQVSDIGSSELNRVELWRANDSTGSPVGWMEIQRESLSGTGPSSGSFNDQPSPSGKYWYGLHVVDSAENWNDEKNSYTGGSPGIYGPIMVEVEPAPLGWESPISTGKFYTEWTNPAEAFVSDDQYATTEGQFLDQDYYNFHFDIPPDSVINGIEVAVEGHGETWGVDDILVEIWSESYNYSQGFEPPLGEWGTKNDGAGGWWILGDGIDDIATGGGPTDLWGVTWQPSDFSDSHFLLKIKTWSNPDRIYIDHIEVKIYYTECDCTSWENQGCGEGDCPLNKMCQSRSCSTAGCPTERCVDDMTCTEDWRVPTATGTIFNEWTNPQNAYWSDDSYSVAMVGPTYQDYYNFNFDVPQTAIIKGIAVMGEGHGEGGLRSSRTGIHIYSYSADEWVGWPTWLYLGDAHNDDTTDIVGGQTDLWGTSWIPSDFSNNNFLLKLYQPSSNWGTWLDQIKVKVYYIEPMCVAPLEGDASGDCKVDHKDLEVMALDWLEVDMPTGSDLNTDYHVDFVDYVIIASDWLKCNLVPSSACWE